MTNEKRRVLVVSTTSLLIFCACFMVGIGLAAAEASLSIDPALTDGLAPTDIFAVTVDINSDGASLAAVGFNLAYDTSALSVTGVTYSGLMGASGSDVIILQDLADDGEISFTAADTTPASQAGTVVTVNFAVKAGAADGLYDLDLKDVDLVDDATKDYIPGVAVNDGQAQVGDDVVIPEDPYVEIIADSGVFGEGDTFQATVMVDSKDNTLAAVELSLGYDTSALSVTGATYSGLMGAEGSDVIIIKDLTDDGMISFSAADTTPAMEAGTLLTIDFEVKTGAVDGIYDLDLTDVTLVNGGAAIAGVDVVDDTVEISSVPNVVPVPEIISHSDGDVVSRTQIVEVEDNSGQDDIKTATFAIFADINGNCDDDDVGEVWTTFATDNDGSDGWTAVLDTTSVPDGQYLIKATLDDGRDSAFYIVCVEVYNPEGIILLPGWNLISFPETLENADINVVLQDFDATMVDSVFYDDASAGMMVVPTTFEPLKAYWVHNNMPAEVVINEEYLTPKVPSTPPSLRLYPGWNAIGHNAKVELSAEISLATVDDCYVKVTGPWVTSANEFAYVGYNGVEGVQNGNVVGTDVFEMDMYEGYYVFVDEECVLA